MQISKPVLMSIALLWCCGAATALDRENLRFYLPFEGSLQPAIAGEDVARELHDRVGEGDQQVRHPPDAGCPTDRGPRHPRCEHPDVDGEHRSVRVEVPRVHPSEGVVESLVLARRVHLRLQPTVRRLGRRDTAPR